MNNSPLAGIKILDLSRVLAGPFCTQLLGDYGADVVKVERPVHGDDTRKWGPPYVTDDEGNQSSESAYYLSANRNKRSLTVDLYADAGQALIKRLIPHFDVLIENFKVGSMARYGLDYATLSAINPRLIYCSITGFGQDGPYAQRAGYDFMVQAMGGIMSMTGPVDGEPYKAGVGIADIMTGMYMNTAILAALHHRTQTGQGQQIDVALLDCQLAWLVNNAQNYLVSGEIPPRFGNGHPTVVPYEVFPSKDGYFALAVGNDRQFRQFCDFIGRNDLSDNPLYAHNVQRVTHREQLVPILKKETLNFTTQALLDGLSARHVPCGPINNIAQVFEHPQIQHRQMKIAMPHPDAGSQPIDLIGNPVKFSRTQVSYRHAPPKLGADNAEVLAEYLGMSSAEVAKLQRDGAI